MAIALTDEHLELAQVARAFLEEHDARGAARAAFDADDALPAFWKAIADVEWFGLHLPEQYGGSGYGLPELAVVLDEMGQVCAPGPFLPTVVASGVIAVTGTPEQQQRLLPKLADGSWVAGVGLDGTLTRDGDTLQGDAGPVLGGGLADVLVLAAGADLCVVERDADGLAIETRPNLDRTRRSAQVRCSSVRVAEGNVLAGAALTARCVLRTLAAAEAAGGATACTEMATEYAKERVAFGRPIGQFQAVKHHCANMLIASQMAAAAAWGAARALVERADAPLPAAIAAGIAIPALLQCAKLNIQVHGGIGFTWEHDAHLYFRRAGALRALVGAPAALHTETTRLVADGATLTAALDLPPEAERLRPELREFVRRHDELPEDERHAAVVDAGFLFPHWPPPYGRAAGALEQVVIDEELAGIPRQRALGPTAWTLPIVLPSLMNHGTDEQKERWIRATMLGDLTWCQLFSEPGAGSDLASLTTRAERDTGGWRVTGQKVWTSSAQFAQLGFALVRTDPSVAKHAGITCMVIDMKAEGVEVRPLREMTGNAAFNEVFLDNVFVPDEDVIGEINRGWTVARTTLGNERVFLGTRAAAQFNIDLVRLAMEKAPSEPAALATTGELIATSHTLTLLNLRAATRAVTGVEPGPEGNIAKAVGTEHEQRLADFALELHGPDGVFADRDLAAVSESFLFTRQRTIAGGTSEIVRNVIAERILGLPRDPKPS